MKNYGIFWNFKNNVLRTIIYPNAQYLPIKNEQFRPGIPIQIINCSLKQRKVNVNKLHTWSQ